MRNWTARFLRQRTRLNRIVALAAAAWAVPAAAATLTWDANPTNPAAPNDGSGNWNTTTDTNWSDGVADSAWVNDETAAIGNGGTAGTITINDAAGTVTAAGINFNAVGSGNYTIAAAGAAALTLTGGANINLASGVSPTIAAAIAGGAGLTVAGAGGTLNLAGGNTFTGPVAINSGGVIVGAGGNLGASTNAVTLGTSNVAPASGDPVGALTIGAGANVTIGSFTAATNNAAATNTLAIENGATLNVNSSLAAPAAGINGVFVVGSPNAFTTAPVVTNLTVSGAGTLNVSGGAAKSSFVVGIGNSPSSTATPTPTLNMSGLANFSFTTGAGPTPTPAGPGGNEFLVGNGSTSMATAFLAQNSTITAGTIAVGDSNPTPGSTGNGAPVTGSNPNTLNLGSGTNVLNANTIILGNGRARGILQWASGVSTGSVTIAGAAGGASTADITVGTSSGGTPAGTASLMDTTGHAATIQAGTVIVGNMAGGTGGTSTTKGGRVDFDTGTFNAANLRLGVATSGTSGGAIVGTFNLGSNANSSGVLNVSNQFLIASNQGGAGASRGNFVIKGGTANINTNIIDNSLLTQPASVTNLTLSGGTLNMNGFAIGTTAAGTGGTRTISSITLPTSGSSAALMNLGGNGINNAGLAMNGTGTLILTGNNPYTGGTTVTAGTLQVGQESDAAPLTNALGAPAAGVTNSATLSFGSSQATSVANVIGGAGTVAQVGSGTTTLNTANTYTGPTALAGGALAASNLADGGSPSSIGASSNAASNLVLTGGTLRYTGGGASSNRLFSISPNGGAIDASGSGAIVFNNAGSIVSADPAARATTTATTTTRVVLPSVLDLAVGMSVSGANLPAGTTISSINRTTSSITLSNTPAVAGADTLSFSTAPRTLTLSGSSAANNTIAGVLSDSAAGGALSVAKSGAGTWALGGANSYSGSTAVSAGTLVLDQSLTTTSGVAVTGGTLQLGPATTHVLRTPSLTITGDGRLDLRDNKLLTATSPGTFDGTAYSGVQGEIQRAYNFGAWDQPGLTTSEQNAGQNAGPLSGTTTIGVATAEQVLFIGPSDTAVFMGQTVTGATTIAMYTYAGDVNLDGLVDGADYGTLDNWIQFPGTDGYANGDVNYDGVIDGADYGVLDNTIQLQGAPIPGVNGASGALAGVTAVPEPSVCGFAAVAAVGLIVRRRRRRRDLSLA